jgi:hypothetical protein
LPETKANPGTAAPIPINGTPETVRLIQHWRHHGFSGVRPFFCQIEAVETAIWLTEVAPFSAKRQNKRQASIDAVSNAPPKSQHKLINSP